MSKQTEKENTKVLQQRRHRRRQWVSFVRMLRYGANNFSRNAWLTVAATAVMTITLLLVFVTVAAQNILANAVNQISEDVDMSIYLENDTTAEQAETVAAEIRVLDNVTGVEITMPDEAQKLAIDANKDDVSYLDATKEAENKFPVTLRVSLDDINDTASLKNYVETSETYKTFAHTTKQPSFLGERRSSIETIAGWTVIAQRIGLAASLVFVAISSLIIFNTIRMAIFSRKEEIHMMKLIGADKHFIRGPFIVEAVVYGFIAAVFATVIGVAGLYMLNDGLGAWLDISSTLALTTQYLGFVALGMIIVGSLIGVISSWMATQRYLKV